MQIHASPVCSVLLQLKHLTPFIMTVSLTQLGGGLDSNCSHLHCQLAEAWYRLVTMFPRLLIISYMQLQAQSRIFLHIYASASELNSITRVNQPHYSLLCSLCTQTHRKTYSVNSECSNRYYNLMQKATELWHGRINLSEGPRAKH